MHAHDKKEPAFAGLAGAQATNGYIMTTLIARLAP